MNTPNILNSKDPSLQKIDGGREGRVGGMKEGHALRSIHSLIHSSLVGLSVYKVGLRLPLLLPQTPEAETEQLRLPQQLCVTDTHECAVRPNNAIHRVLVSRSPQSCAQKIVRS